MRLNLLRPLLEEAYEHMHATLCASALGVRLFVQRTCGCLAGSFCWLRLQLWSPGRLRLRCHHPRRRCGLCKTFPSGCPPLLHAAAFSRDVRVTPELLRTMRSALAYCQKARQARRRAWGRG